MASLIIPSILIACLITMPPIKTQANHHGFTTDLIHRNSPLSPTYNPTLNQWDRVKNTIHRSINRAKLITQSLTLNDVQSQVITNKGEYLMELSIGTPPIRQLAIADTGSDLIWIQCQPCVACYDQKLPIFNPKSSSTYKVEPCESNPCKALGSENGYCSSKGTCQYSYNYGDQSHTYGDLAIETITFNPNRNSDQNSFPNITFGCGHDNNGTFRPEGTGLVGLGGGPLSLVTQIDSPKFSYCLTPFDKSNNSTSKISFGTQGEVSGRDVSSVSLVKQTPKTFYFLTLEGISVGSESKSKSNYQFLRDHNKRFSKKFQEIEEGNIIIDSGTTLTFLPTSYFDDLVSTLDEKIQGQKVDDPMGTLQLCYQSYNDGKDLNIPLVTVHFTGADWVLKPYNTFIQVDDEVVCLAFLPVGNLPVSIFGNIAQGNFLVGYDLEAGKLSFKPTDCSNLD